MTITTNTNKISYILLIDDHKLFSESLSLYIERFRPGVKLLIASSASEIESHMTKQENFDLVIMDLYMPNTNGIDELKRFKKEYSDTPIAIISGIAQEQDINNCIKEGAIAFFTKSMTGNALIRAIDLVLTGERFIPVDYQSQPTPSPAKLNKNAMNKVQLTPREKEVLEHLLTGARNQEIADILGLKIVTIKLHIRGLCRKLSAKNRTQAVLNAQRLGLVETL